MDAALDLGRWTEKPRGVAWRRWVIVSAGLRQLLATRFFKGLLILAWTAGATIAAAGFVFSQSIASGGWLETFAASLGPRPQAVVAAFCAFVLVYPDICIGGIYTLLFWWHSYVGLGLSLVALTALAPRLIARDRASQALTIYLSRPLTSLDYLLGKLGVIVGVLALVWTGPLLFGWALGMIFAPGRDFLIHSFEPLLRAGLFNLLALVALGSIALGVSALCKSSRQTIVWWIGLWIVASVVADIPHAPDWLRRASFSYDLREARRAILRPGDALVTAGRELPLLNRDFSTFLTRSGGAMQSSDLRGALAGLGALVTLSSLACLRRLRPE